MPETIQFVGFKVPRETSCTAVRVPFGDCRLELTPQLRATVVQFILKRSRNFWAPARSEGKITISILKKK